MNRFSNYLDNQKIAKAFLQSATDAIRAHETERAVGFLVEAVKYQMTASNNIASLYFEGRKKR